MEAAVPVAGLVAGLVAVSAFMLSQVGQLHLLPSPSYIILAVVG